MPTNTWNFISHVIHICPLLKFHKYKQNILYSKFPKGDVKLIPRVYKRDQCQEEEVCSQSDMDVPFICMATNSIGQPVINQVPDIQ